MAGKLKRYLQDPFLKRLYDDIRKAGPLKSISVDITHACNIRCEGCYFLVDGMDQYQAPRDEAEFDAFIEREKARGTNYVTVVGGEPSLVLHRLKKIYDNFWMIVVTNGLRRIPYEGFENMPIAVSVWGDHETDRRLRGSGEIDIFARGLKNYKDDPRVVWYFTTCAGNAHEIESVVEQCVANGNYVGFNFYGDLAGLGGALDHRQGFGQVRHEINKMIDRYPDKVLLTSYVYEVISTGRLYDEEWGYDVCASVSVDHEKNAERLKSGRPYTPHFRAYYPDLKTTRRCCVGEDRDCSTCLDVWAHTAWIILNMRRHMGSKQEFTNWLTSLYSFYLVNRIVDFEAGIQLLPEIHERLSYSREQDEDTLEDRALARPDLYGVPRAA